ncbi:MAG: GNAT family N-acetyltransferase [Clostridiales bacterium]|nr:GNAT family N-acetyltransferase [Clostridiales bacterium]
MDFILREWTEEDAETLAACANNPKIAANLRDVFPCPYTLADARAYINGCAAGPEEKQLCRAIAIDGQAAGSIGVFLGDDVYRRSGELGYWLAEPYWGQGIMTRAVEQICREAFDRFVIDRIYAEPFARNQGSRRVLEKAGFRLEGVMRKGVYKNGETLDYCMYALLRP